MVALRLCQHVAVRLGRGGYVEPSSTSDGPVGTASFFRGGGDTSVHCTRSLTKVGPGYLIGRSSGSRLGVANRRLIVLDIVVAQSVTADSIQSAASAVAPRSTESAINVPVQRSHR